MSEVILTIHDLSRGGAGVGKLDSGEIVFVPFTAPGDQVRARILSKNKTYSQGELVEILKPSPQRVTPPCKVFGICGGCAWQHLPYSLQFDTKKKGVLHALKRAGLNSSSITVDDLPADHAYSYRNRVQLRGHPKEKVIGFFAKNSSSLIAIDRCEIADERINQSLPEIREKGFKEFQRDFKVEVQVDEDGSIRSAWNRGHAAFGFRQVNDLQNEKLKQWVADHAGSGNLLLDLFGGAGNLSIPLLNRFQEIHCVDVSVPNHRPKELENVAPEKFQYHRSDVLGWLNQLPKKDKLRPATILLDPPREGLGSTFHEIHSLIMRHFRIERVLLVGCDVDAFARDTYRFTQKGLRLEKLGILDLFPQTPHVESLALLLS